MKKQNMILPILMLILVIVIFMLLYQAIVSSIIIIDQQQTISDEKKQPEIKYGKERTDVVICCQKPDNRILMLLNLSYREFPDMYPEEYPADTLEQDGMLPGDFAQLVYTAKYTLGGEDEFNAEITSIKQGSGQISATEALAKRAYQSHTDMWGISRTADAEPIQIYQQEYADFLMIPAGNCYYLFTPNSDEYQIFDQYKQVSKEIDINGQKKILRTWVLCNHNMTDGAILDALYQGRVTDNPDLFFVGYDSDYPYQFTAGGYSQPFLYHMNKSYIASDVTEVNIYHLTPEHYTSIALMPEEVQKEISANWNKSDDILVFSGNYDESSELTFDDNNRPVATSGNSYGYLIFYLQSGFFENICSGITDE